MDWPTYPYWEAPWMVPVPVTKGSYRPLDRRHAELNVVASLAHMEAFGFDSRQLPPEQLLFADLQTDASLNVLGRLGSGRAGFFGGKYLKGVGRTHLAANWNDGSDRYHNSGHLLASAAAREYLISRYLVAAGLGHTINPCEGLLVAAAPAQELIESAFAAGLRAGRSVAPCDRHLAAITVKGSDFARPSNFVWLLNHHYPYDGSLAEWMVRLCHHAAPASGPVVMKDCTPGRVVQALERAVSAGLQSFEGFQRIGVFWGSYHNNFTLDGRFLDLELPTLLGAPFFGVFRTNRHAPPLFDLDRPIEGGDCGWEVLAYLEQMGTFLRYLRHRLRFLIQEHYAGGAARTFLEELLVDLARAFPREHPVHDPVRREGLAVDMLGKALDLTSRERAFARRLVRRRRLDREKRRSGSRAPLALVPTGFDLASSEPTVRFFAYEFAELGAGRFVISEPARLLSACLQRIDGVTDPDRFLEEVKMAADLIEREVRDRAGGERRALLAG